MWYQGHTILSPTTTIGSFPCRTSLYFSLMGPAAILKAYHWHYRCIPFAGAQIKPPQDVPQYADYCELKSTKRQTSAPLLNYLEEFKLGAWPLLWQDKPLITERVCARVCVCACVRCPCSDLLKPQGAEPRPQLSVSCIRFPCLWRSHICGVPIYMCVIWPYSRVNQTHVYLIRPAGRTLRGEGRFLPNTLLMSLSTSEILFTHSLSKSRNQGPHPITFPDSF